MSSITVKWVKRPGFEKDHQELGLSSNGKFFTIDYNGFGWRWFEVYTGNAGQTGHTSNKLAKKAVRDYLQRMQPTS